MYEYITDDEQQDAYKGRVKQLEVNLFELRREHAELNACLEISSTEQERFEVNKALDEVNIKIKYGVARLKVVQAMVKMETSDKEPVRAAVG